MILVLALLGLLPPTDINAVDKPNDAGSTILVSWTLSPDDPSLDGYIVLRKEESDTLFQRIGSTAQGVFSFEDDETTDGNFYTYVVAAVSNNTLYYSAASNLTSSHPQIFHTGRMNVLIAVIIFAALLAYFVYKARTGKKLYINSVVREYAEL